MAGTAVLALMMPAITTAPHHCGLRVLAATSGGAACVSGVMNEVSHDMRRSPRAATLYPFRLESVYQRPFELQLEGRAQ